MFLYSAANCIDGPFTTFGCQNNLIAQAAPHVFTGTGLTIGNTYYLMIDGVGGAVCNYNITAVSGVNVLAITPSAPSICAGASATLTASGGGTTYTWSPATGLNTTTGATVIATPAATTTYTVSSAGVGGCPNTKTVLVTVLPAGGAPNTNFTYITPICTNVSSAPPIPATGFTTGGTHTSTTGLSINATTGVINGSASTAGNYNVTYTVPASGCITAGVSMPVAVTITASSTLTGTFSYASPLCNNITSPFIFFSGGFTIGGTYTSTPAGLSINNTTGIINPSLSTPNTYTVTYNIPASGCVAAFSTTATVTIAAASIAVTNFTYTTPVCATLTSATPTGATGFTTGGTYTSTTGLSINATTGVINPSTSTAGTYVVTYSTLATACRPAASSTFSITISAASIPVTTFSYSSPACSNLTSSTPILTAGFTTGGTFSSTAGLTINASTGVINPNTSTAGTYTVTYSIAASGCNVAASSTANITIASSTTPITNFSYPAPLCALLTSVSPTLPAGFTTGGTFLFVTPGLVINASTGAINPSTSTPGNYGITYSTAATACSPATNTGFAVTIVAATVPVTTFSYTSPVCGSAISSTPSLSAGFTTGGTFTSTTGLSINTTTGVINPSACTAGTYTITYSIASSGCSSAGTNTANITIAAAGAPVTGFSYASPSCNTLTSLAPIVATGFSTGGIFSSTAGLSINATTGIINPSTSIAGTYIVTYNVAASGCISAGTSTFSVTITSSFVPNTNFLYGGPVCSSVTSLSPTPGTGFTTGGTYTSTAGLSINAASGIINPSTSTVGTYVVTYSVLASGCNSAASATASITIQSIIPTVGGFSYASPVCTSVLSAGPILVAGFSTGGIFSSTSGLIIDAATGVINPGTSTPGSYIISYNLAASGCNAAVNSTANITVTTSGVVITNFSYTSPICANVASVSPIGTAGFTAGGTYSSSGGLTLNATTGVITPTTSTAGTYTITYTVAASSCSVASSSTANITISPVITPITSFSYAAPICNSLTTLSPTLIAGFATGGTFSSTAGLSLNAATGVINPSASVPGTYTINYNLAASGCNTAGAGLTIVTIIASTPAITGFSYASPACNSLVNLNPTFVPGFTTGGIFTAATGLTINSTTGAINPSTSPPGTYIVNYAVPASGCRSAGNFNTTITINLLPTFVTGFTYPTPLCSGAGNTAPILVTGFTSGGTFASLPVGLNINAANGIINPLISLPGIYIVTYTIPAGACNPVIFSLPFSVTITPQLPPVITASPISYCLNKTATVLTAIGVPTTTINWYTTATGGTALTAAPVPSTNTVGSTTYYVDQTKTGFCDAVRIPVVVNVNALPTADAGPDKVINFGESVVLNGTASGTNISFLWTPISNSSTLTPTVSPLVNTAYELRVTSADGCIAFDSAKVIVVKALKIPNVFSPNGDNINDKWIIENLANYIDKRVEIFNRYGQSIFYSLDYSKPWDGTFKGKDLPVGVYFYIIKTTKNGIDDVYKGSITILR